MPIPNIPPSLEYLPNDKTTLKVFGTMLNKLWQRLFVVLSPIFNASIVYTPVVTAGSGSFTTVSATGRYTVFGKYVLIQITVTVTNAGTAVDPVVSLPLVAIAAIAQMISGVEVVVNGKSCNGVMNQAGWGDTSHIQIRNYDNSNPAVTGAVLVLQGFYEIGG